MICRVIYAYTHNYNNTTMCVNTSSNNYTDTTNGTSHVNNNHMNNNRNNDKYEDR